MKNMYLLQYYLVFTSKVPSLVSTFGTCPLPPVFLSFSQSPQTETKQNGKKAMKNILRILIVIDVQDNCSTYHHHQVFSPLDSD